MVQRFSRYNNIVDSQFLEKIMKYKYTWLIRCIISFERMGIGADVEFSMPTDY